jgi:hypothetical protein
MLEPSEYLDYALVIYAFNLIYVMLSSTSTLYLGFTYLKLGWIHFPQLHQVSKATCHTHTDIASLWW